MSWWLFIYKSVPLLLLWIAAMLAKHHLTLTLQITYIKNTEQMGNRTSCRSRANYWTRKKQPLLHPVAELECLKFKPQDSALKKKKRVIFLSFTSYAFSTVALVQYSSSIFYGNSTAGKSPCNFFVRHF